MELPGSLPGEIFSWEGNPRSVNDGIKSAIDSSDCLLFDDPTAQKCIQNGNIYLHLNISKVSHRYAEIHSFAILFSFHSLLMAHDGMLSKLQYSICF